MALLSACWRSSIPHGTARQGPELAALFAVQTLLSSAQGGVYTQKQMKTWMA